MTDQQQEGDEQLKQDEPVGDDAATPGEATEEEEAVEAADADAELEPDDDEPDDDQAGAGDGDEQSEAHQQALTEKEIEKGYKKLNSEATRHANRVSEIMGEAAQSLLPCELCAPMIPGFRWDREPDEVTIARVRAAVGLADLTGYKPATDARMCDDCGGKGRVLSGSKVEQFATIKCLRCKEKGWIPVGGTRETQQATADNGVVVEGRDELEERPPDADPWGRTPDDVNYGRMPQYVRA